MSEESGASGSVRKAMALAFGSVVLAATGCSDPTAARGKGIERVILVSIDTLRADAIGAYDGLVSTTPEIDALCARSQVFTDALSQAPSTAISHKSILYSVYPSIHKTTSKVRPTEPSDSPLQWLQQEGFTTAAFVGGGQLSPEFGFERGFDTYYSVNKDKPKGDSRRDVEILEGEVDAWLEQNRDKRFLLFFHNYEVHSPYVPPEPYRSKHAGWYEGDIDPTGKNGAKYYNHRVMSEEDFEFVRDLYAAEVEYVDGFIGRLMRKLESLGIADHTAVILFSDHGESLGERGYVGHNRLHNIQLRVPLILRVPGMEARRVAEPVEALDIMPTVFSLLGVKPRYAFQGRDLLETAQRGAPQRRLRIAEQEGRVCVQDGEWKLVFTPGNGDDELYRLGGNLDEGDEVSREENAEVAERLREAFLDMLRESEDLSSRFLLDDLDGPMLSPTTESHLRELGYIEK
jgi:arylsulfatase A-like enzyme